MGHNKPNGGFDMDDRSLAPESTKDLATSADPGGYPAIEDLIEPSCWHRWAVGFSAQQQFLRAAEFFRHAIVLDPCDPLLRFDFAVALVKAERHHDAITAFSEASRLRPLWTEPHEIELQLRSFVQHRPPPLDTAASRFSTLFSPQSDFATDVRACSDLLKAIGRLYPRPLVNAQLIALAECRLANPAMLVAVARGLTGVAVPRNEPAAQWMTIRDGLAAKRFSLLAVRRRPTFETLLTAALVLQVLNEHSHALVLLDRAISERPDDTEALTAQAELLIEAGETKSGIRQLTSLIQSSAASGRLRLMRAMAGSAGHSLPHEIEELQRLLSTNPIEVCDAHERWLLLYTLGWRYEQMHQVDAAFDAYAKAAKEKKTKFLLKHPVPEDAIARASLTQQQYDREFFENRKGWGVSSRQPLFIVGLPRSGTTLVEQILARHPNVCGAGELHDMSIAGRTIAEIANADSSTLHHEASAGIRSAAYPPGLELLSSTQVRHLARDHLAALSSIDRQATFVIDKMPTNFQLLGMIALFFPGARVIHCVRNLLDTCVSCYRNNLAWPFFDLDAMAGYATAYQHLMAHWQHALPLEMLEVSYEQVVADLTGQTKRILDFLELSWVPECLKFYESPRSVRTPSRTQVRQPIYTTSVGAWRSCRDHIQPLLNRLPLADAGQLSLTPSPHLFVRSDSTSLS